MKVSDKKQIAITIEVSNNAETSNQIEISYWLKMQSKKDKII